MNLLDAIKLFQASFPGNPHMGDGRQRSHTVPGGRPRLNTMLRRRGEACDVASSKPGRAGTVSLYGSKPIVGIASNTCRFPPGGPGTH
ncbi:MAG: hypothetical protein KatS3mg111_1255 [Pirellulaceae bacterium]|nr:MAG: hypothetical protein KatS3mg111_1255 [Pirellulaceae bacterium]